MWNKFETNAKSIKGVRTMKTGWKKRKKNLKLRLLWFWYRLRGISAPMIHYINAVSYTHLDVYKRQWVSR